MPTAEELRARAEECDRWADEAQDPTHREIFREIARRWRTLAEDEERAARARGGNPRG
jgi:hypothetical protein